MTYAWLTILIVESMLQPVEPDEILETEIQQVLHVTIAIGHQIFRRLDLTGQPIGVGGRNRPRRVQIGRRGRLSRWRRGGGLDVLCRCRDSE